MTTHAPRTGSKAPPADLPCSRLRRGALTFAALTVAGLVGLFVFGSPNGPLPGLADLRPAYLLLALAGALLDLVLGGLRFQIFIRRAHPESPLGLPIRADLAGRFVGAVTPSQSGGGPAQLYVLHRGGIPVAESLSFLLVNLISTLSFFVLAGGLSAWLFRDLFGEGALGGLVQYGFVVVGALLGLMVLSLVRPELVSRPLARLARRSVRDGQPEGFRGRAARFLESSLEQYRVACHRFVRQNPWLPLASFGLTVLIYLNKFGLAWLVMRGLGVESDFAVTVALMALVHFSVFLAPSPGGSGIAEVATGAFVSILLPGSLVGPFTLVYRALIVYGPAAAGAVVLLAELHRGHRRTVSWTDEAPEGGSTALDPRRSWPSPRRVPLALLLATTVAVAAPAAADTPCPLCARGAPPTTPLLRAEVDAAARELADRNRATLERIDALFREGRLGSPDSAAARRRAQLMARLSLANWYSFLLPFVSGEEVRTVRAAALATAVARYCEAVVVPLPRLRELRIGQGHVCARYDLGGEDEEGHTALGGRRLRYRVRDLEIDGVSRRILGLDWGSSGMGNVEVLVADHYGFRMARSRVTHVDGSQSDVYLALGVSGAWVRRCGIHRPAAFAFWTTRPSDRPPYLPRAPRVGSLIYIPGLKFTLPILPDIDLDDVRVLGLPMPFLDTDDVLSGALPEWLPTDTDLTLDSWTSEGEIPTDLRAYLPTSQEHDLSLARHQLQVRTSDRR